MEAEWRGEGQKAKGAEEEGVEGRGGGGGRQGAEGQGRGEAGFLAWPARCNPARGAWVGGRGLRGRVWGEYWRGRLRGEDGGEGA